MTRQWPAPAKLNLFLYVIGRRADGYHLLQTLFQFLNYGDTLSITSTVGGRIRLLNPVAGVAEEDNLIVRAFSAILSCEETRRRARSPRLWPPLFRMIVSRSQGNIFPRLNSIFHGC